MHNASQGIKKAGLTLLAGASSCVWAYGGTGLNVATNNYIGTTNPPKTANNHQPWQSLGTMLLFLAVMLAVFVLVRKKAAGMAQRAGKRIKILERVSLGTRHGVVLIEAGSKQYLLGLGPQSVNTIAELGATEPTPSRSSQNAQT